MHASHHGSRTFFKKGEDDEELIKEHLTKIRPEYLVLSVSHPSKHGHPHSDAMKLYGEVVSKKNMRYTETKENLQAHVLRIHKSDKDRKWYYAVETDTDLVDDYLLEEKKVLVATKAPSYYVNIGARVGYDPDGPFTRRYPSNGRPLEKNLHIRFYRESCNVPEPYEVRWQVTNFGVEAERNNDVYHDSGTQQRGDRDFESRLESTRYRGSHYMDCVILKNGIVICRKRYVVNIQ